MTTYRNAAAADWPAIKLLLDDNALPLAGARDHLSHFIVCEQRGEIAGCVGAEVYRGAALLRSLVVAVTVHGQGIGTQLVERILAQLKAGGVREVVLLTTTAQPFFAARGFAAVARDGVPAAVKSSEEFRGACPASAVAMTRRV